MTSRSLNAAGVAPSPWLRVVQVMVTESPGSQPTAGDRREVGDDQVGIGRQNRREVQRRAVVELSRPLRVGLGDGIRDIGGDGDDQGAGAAVALGERDRRLPRGCAAGRDHTVEGHEQVREHLVRVGPADHQAVDPGRRGRQRPRVANVELERDGAAGAHVGAGGDRELGHDQVDAGENGRHDDVADLQRARIGRGIDRELHEAAGALAAQDREGTAACVVGDHVEDRVGLGHVATREVHGERSGQLRRVGHRQHAERRRVRKADPDRAVGAVGEARDVQARAGRDVDRPLVGERGVVGEGAGGDVEGAGVDEDERLGDRVRTGRRSVGSSPGCRSC